MAYNEDNYDARRRRYEMRLEAWRLLHPKPPLFTRRVKVFLVAYFSVAAILYFYLYC